MQRPASHDVPSLCIDSCSSTQTLRALACLCADVDAQALLSLPCLARDLSQFDRRSSSDSGGEHSSQGNEAGRGCSSFSQLQLPPNGVTAAMVACLRQYQAACSRCVLLSLTVRLLALGYSRASREHNSSAVLVMSPQVSREAIVGQATYSACSTSFPNEYCVASRSDMYSYPGPCVFSVDHAQGAWCRQRHHHHHGNQPPDGAKAHCLQASQYTCAPNTNHVCCLSVCGVAHMQGSWGGQRQRHHHGHQPPGGAGGHEAARQPLGGHAPGGRP